MLGVDRITYAKYESGASEPNYDTLLALADIFEVSIDYLLGRTDQKDQPVPMDKDELNNLDDMKRQLMSYVKTDDSGAEVSPSCANAGSD